MDNTVGHRGYQLKKRPRRYPMLPQQIRFRKALEFCGIEKGITKMELMDKMVNCIPRFFKEHKDDDKGVHREAL